MLKKWFPLLKVVRRRSGLYLGRTSDQKGRRRAARWWKEVSKTRIRQIFFFKVSSSKSNTNQRKVCTPYTNEESIGQEACQGVDLDVNPDQGRTLLCNNYFAHAELAKVVVGIESNNSQCEAVHILDQERNVEAHCHVDRIPRVTQSGKTDLGLGTSPEFPRCENVYGNTNLGSLRGGKQVSVRRIELL